MSEMMSEASEIDKPELEASEIDKPEFDTCCIVLQLADKHMAS